MSEKDMDMDLNEQNIDTPEEEIVETPSEKAQAVKNAPNKEKKEKKTDKKSEKKAKPGIFARIGRWLREMKSELKKVQWPTAKQTANNTLIVIVCVIVVGVCIWLFDWLATSIIQALISLF